MLRRSSFAGFTLIELAVALAVVSLLLVMGMPTLNTVLEASRLKAAASAFTAAAQQARALAISCNQRVDFAPGDGVGNLSAAWSVVPSGAECRLTGGETKPLQESSGNNLQVINADGVAVVSFNGLGAATFRDTTGTAIAVNPLILSFTGNSGAGSCVGGGGSLRCLDVRITAGGQIRLCDPQAAAGDSRVC